MEYVSNLVSVIIPTYKRAERLKRAITSALAQTYENIEVLVVSDNEPNDEYTEADRKIVESFCDDRVRLLVQQKHINGAAARNAGIRAAKGEYIAFLDDDDYWEKQKIEEQVALLKSLGDTYGGVTCNNKHYVNSKLTAAIPPIKEGDLCKKILLRLADLSTDALLLKHTCLDETGYFDENLRRHQEVQLMTYFTAKYDIKLLDKYYVCVDDTKNENQPDPERMEKVKEDFFRAVAPVLSNFSEREQKQIYALHAFELGILYFRNGRKAKGLRKAAAVLKDPVSIKYALMYLMKKIRSRTNLKKLAREMSK